MFLFVGLGNPGAKYELTRHNIGFLVADEIASSYGFGPFRSRFQALTADGTVGGEKVLLMKPATFMNDSGRAVGEAVRFFKTSRKYHRLCDEIDLVPGKLRVKRGGGARSQWHPQPRSHIGTAYWRVRIGVGHPGDKNQVKDYVLQNFAKAERTGWLSKLVPAVADEADLLVRGDESGFMSRVSQTVFPTPKPPDPQNRRNRQQAGSARPTAPAKTGDNSQEN